MDGCPSAAFILLNELFRDIGGGRSVGWVFDELGVSELSKVCFLRLVGLLVIKYCENC